MMVYLAISKGTTIKISELQEVIQHSVKKNLVKQPSSPGFLG